MDINIHGVCSVRIEAHSSPIRYDTQCGVEQSFLSHVQELEFFDREGKSIGRLTLYLDSPDAAIPAGDLSRLIRENELKTVFE